MTYTGGMVKKLVSRSEFARLANVSPAAVTKACKDTLAPAKVDKRINIEHPAALEYLAAHDLSNVPVQPANGIDPLYETALEYMLHTGGISVRKLAAAMHISKDRSAKLIKLVKATGLMDQPARSPHNGNKEFVAAPIIARPAPRTPVSREEVRQRVVKAARLARFEEEQDDQEEEESDDLPGTDQYPGAQVEDLAGMTLRDLVAKFGTAERFKNWLQARKVLVDIGAKEIANAEKRGLLIPREFVVQHVIGNFDRVHSNLLSDCAQHIARSLVSQIKAGATPEECETFVSEQISRHIREGKDMIARALSNV